MQPFQEHGKSSVKGKGTILLLSLLFVFAIVILTRFGEQWQMTEQKLVYTFLSLKLELTLTVNGPH